jgi:CRISPR-associated protein Cas1
MQIVIDDYGTFIGKEGNRFIIDRKENKEEFSADNVDQIIISRASSLSTDAVKLAIENNIDIVYLDHFGMPIGRIYPCRLGGTTLTRRKQAEISKSEKSMNLVKLIVSAKIKNQICLLKSLRKTRENIDFSSEVKSLEDSLARIKAIKSNPNHETKDNIMGIEGSCSNQYFFCLSKILPFKERQHEAKDPFNAMLNYGYGILYSETEKSCILAGLDPYLGFLHSDRYGKPSMVLDIIEQFRQPIVDRAIITLFAQKQVTDSDTEISGNSLLLTKEGRKKVSETVLERLHAKINYNGKEMSFQSIMLEQARSIARYILQDGYRYKPFVYSW